MTMTKHETEIVADEKSPTIDIVREFDAPAEQVFRAHVDPELYARWVGPRSVTTRITRWDARTGGAWALANERDGEQIASFTAASTRCGNTSGSCGLSPTKVSLTQSHWRR